MHCGTLLFALLVPAAAPGAEIIDRIAVVVGNGVITASEVEREVRLTDFLNGNKLDLGTEAKRKAVQRLIEQRLIRRELQLTRYPTPPESEAGQMLEQIRKTRFAGQAKFEQAAGQYGITEEDLKAHLHWQLTALRFIELRFRPGVQITDEDVQQEMERLMAANGSAKPHPAGLDDYRARIREDLIEKRIDQQVDAWLKKARESTKIEIREGALR
jgi:hypothetical protein